MELAYSQNDRKKTPHEVFFPFLLNIGKKDLLVLGHVKCGIVDLGDHIVEDTIRGKIQLALMQFSGWLHNRGLVVKFRLR